MAYRHFSIEEREVIQIGLWNKRSIRSIALALARSPSSISREIQKNRPPERSRAYAPRLANERAFIHRTHRGRIKRLKNDIIRSYVKAKLKEGYSPEQVAGRLSLEHPEYTISHEAIYQFIYAEFHRGGRGRLLGEDFRMYLKRRHKARQRKGMRRSQRLWRPKGLSIDVRPKEVERRRIPGHWEGDSMVSRKSTVGLNTLVERTTGLVFISKIRNATAQETTTAVTRRLGVLPSALCKTLTLDNGSENADHAEITKTLGTRVYFAHPYHSWERGTNENTNGLIRWYLPKGTDFATITDAAIAHIEWAINNRPRKRLGWRTPLEAWSVALRG